MQHIKIDLDALVSATDAARAATTDTRWLNAIEKAYNWLVQQDTVNYDAASHELTLVSPDSGKTYHSNSVCSCRAFEDGRACYHRAASRLVRRSLEQQEHQQKTQQIKALASRLAQARRRAYQEMGDLFI